MNVKEWACLFVLFLICLTIGGAGTGTAASFYQPNADPQETAGIEFITAEELKEKLAKNQQVTIIDVRATSGLLNSDSKIKGAFHVKLRRLRSRLAFSPLKDVSRDREVVTYCACPNDESSVQAARVLLDAGFKRVRALKGGWVGWKKVNGQIQSVARGI